MIIVMTETEKRLMKIHRREVLNKLAVMMENLLRMKRQLIVKMIKKNYSQDSKISKIKVKIIIRFHRTKCKNT